MPFKKAKQIVKEKTAKESIEADKLELSNVKRILSKYNYTTKEYIDKLTYHGRENDKRQYNRHLRSELSKILKDNKATAEELRKLRGRLETRSQNLINKFKEKQCAYEAMKHKEISDKVAGDVRGANFKEAIRRLDEFEKSLSPFNRTSVVGFRNMDEPYLRLDLKIKEQKLDIKEQQIAYKKVLKKGRYFAYRNKPKTPNYIMGKKNGEITLGLVYWNGEEIKAKKTVKRNWLDLLNEAKRDNVQILTARKITNEGIKEGKDFSVDMDTEIAEKRAEIAETKLLKQINRIYSYEGLENLPEKQKELVKKALEENLYSMELYFRRAHKVILPTEEFKKLSPERKQDAFKKMLTGAQKIIRREQLKEKIAAETDKAKKLYYKGEHAMRTGRFIDAYSYYRQFQKTDIQFDHDNPDERKEALELSMDAAEKLKIASLRIIDLADRYIMAAAHKIPPDAAKQALQLTKKVRNLIKRGEAQDLHSAMSKVNSNWRTAPKASSGSRYLSRGSERAGGGTSQLFPTSAAGKSKILLTLQGHILKRLAVATEHTDDDKRFKALLNEARSARDNKLYEATSVLLKEAMGPELSRHRRELQGTPEYRKKIKKIYNLSYFDRLEIVSKTAPKLARKMVGEEKFNNLPKDKQEKLIKRFADMLMKKKIRALEQKYVFNSYLNKYKGTRSAAAAEFIDMENPFDDWSPWKWSDRAWDNIKKETLINGMMMAVSGGFASLVRGAATYGVRALAARILGSQIAKSIPARLGIGLAAFGTEVLTFETSMAGMQYLSGDRHAFDNFRHRLVHGGRILGVMHLGSSVITPLLRGLTPYAGMSAQELTAFKRAVQKAVPRTLSAAGFEAPLLTGMSMKYDKPEGMSWLSIYANSLKDIAAIGVGRKIFNSATGNLFPRMTTRYQVRSKILDLKGSKSAAEAAKGQLLDGLIKKGEIPLEAIGKILETHLTANEIAELARFMKDPQNQQFLLALKAAQEGGAAPKELDTVISRILSKLKKIGISNKNAKYLLENDLLIPQSLSFKVNQRIVKTEKPTSEEVHAALNNIRMFPEQRFKILIRMTPEELKNSWTNNSKTCFEALFQGLINSANGINQIKMIIDKFGSLHSVKEIAYESFNRKIKSYLESPIPNDPFFKADTAKANILLMRIKALFNDYNYLMKSLSKKEAMEKLSQGNLTIIEIKELHEHFYQKNKKEFKLALLEGVKKKLEVLSAETQTYENYLSIIKDIYKQLNIIGINSRRAIMQSVIGETINEAIMLNWNTGNKLLHHAFHEVFGFYINPAVAKFDVLSKNPYGRRYKGLEHKEFMATIKKAISKLKPEIIMKMSPEEIYKDLLKANPELVGSEAQIKVVLNAINKYKKALEHVELFKNSKEKDREVKRILSEYSEVFDNIKALKYKLIIEDGHIFIYLPTDLFLAALNGMSQSNFLRAKQKGLLQNREDAPIEGFHARSVFDINTRYGIVSIMNGGSLKYNRGKKRWRNKKTENHEKEHANTAFLNIAENYENLNKAQQKALKDGNYKKYLELSFQHLLQLRVRDEIYSFLRDGTIQKDGVGNFWNWFKKNYVERNLPEIPKELLNELSPYYNQLKNKYNHLALKAIREAVKIIKYPNGYNLLTVTDITHWNRLLKDLRQQYGDI